MAQTARAAAPALRLVRQPQTMRTSLRSRIKEELVGLAQQHMWGRM